MASSTDSTAERIGLDMSLAEELAALSAIVDGFPAATPNVARSREYFSAEFRFSAALVNAYRSGKLRVVVDGECVVPKRLTLAMASAMEEGQITTENGPAYEYLQETWERALAATERELQQARSILDSAEFAKECVWRPDDDGVYHTTCGNAFTFIDAGPKENHMTYCCYCGKGLLSAAPGGDNDEFR